MRDLRLAIAMKFSSSAPQGCAGLAPQLTALFDGEADEVMTSQARAHLLSCPDCSRLWLDWTRYRDTLQSEPMPAPPPTLLWRVLISYRVAAFARPARRHSSLPQISAIPLREIEAPLPPRLTQHILARTTRKPSVHVMLTPLSGPAPIARSHFKGRAFAFRHAPLWAAPALALWILMLGRADFNATLPIVTPDSSLAVGSAIPESVAPADSNSSVGLVADIISPIPVAPVVADSAERGSRPQTATGAVAAREVSQTTPRALVSVRSNVRAQSADLRAQNIKLVTLASTPRSRSLRSGRSQSAMNGILLMALDAGRRDMARARTSPRPDAITPIVQIPVATPATRMEPIANQQQLIPIARAVKAPPRVARRTRFIAPENTVTTRVTLAVLASPISPIRVISAARVRAAKFSEDSLRPRVAHLSADGRRLARVLPDEGAIPLRVSRPIAGAPTLRETSFNNGDNGPKLDELRSAVDDFRASVAGDE